jgi:hypothetical protein
MFPDARKGQLDTQLLKKLGLSQTRMQSKDALFFYQLLLPICDPAKSRIDGDPRHGFYCEVAKFTNVYGAKIGAFGSSY